MDSHVFSIVLDVGYIALGVAVSVQAVTRAVALRLLGKRPIVEWVALVIFGLFALGNVLALLNDVSSRTHTRQTVSAIAVGYFFLQLILPLILSVIFAVQNARRMRRLQSERRRLLKELSMQALAEDHPEAAATVSALTDVLAQQGRSALWQSIGVGFIFYLLGVLTPYVLSAVLH